MAETDWREILSFSQRELGKADKEKLCESLSWMEADDIELNFTDLKTLFRLAQDILKYKSEQVNNLFGQLETVSRKSGKKKAKSQPHESPISIESVIEIEHQEELIKANKEIMRSLIIQIADLEGKKNKLEIDVRNKEDSDSSRDALAEIYDLVQLENEVAMKNRHIRKLLGDLKLLEEENTKFKEKTSVLKEKLTEASQLIDNLTEQLLNINNEVKNLRDVLGESEETKVKLTCEIEALRKEKFKNESLRENVYEEIKSKAQHWKIIAKTRNSEVEALSIENEQLKKDLTRSSETASPKVKKNNAEELKIKELQEKLMEASNEIDQSANLINILRLENRKLKSCLEETQDYSVSENRNESDEGKEKIMINKLKKRVKTLSVNLQATEEMVAIRERELAEVASELQLVQSQGGINTLLEGLKHKKRELKVKDEGLKSLVQEINNYSQQVNNLQLENETLRQTNNIPPNEAIYTEGIVKKYRDLENSNKELSEDIKKLESKLVNVELENRRRSLTNMKITKLLYATALDKHQVEEAIRNSDSDDDFIHGGDTSRLISKHEQTDEQQNVEEAIPIDLAEQKAIMEENEGLRRGLQEILNFLKDNSTTSSGILALECPSLEAVLQSMEARHTAGWFAPHMTTIMELRTAMGGKDALMKALHEARKETYDVLTQLSKETQKSVDLEHKLQDLQNTETNINPKEQKLVDISNSTSAVEFGSWIAEKDQHNFDVGDKNQVEDMIFRGNLIYEGQLKKGLEYFHHKFKVLHDKITSMSIQAVDDQNKWSLQEEQFKAEIENLKGQVQQHEDEDISENSPGLISLPSPIYLQRKCTYLEESYKYIRTLNENIKNENMEAKKEIMSLSSDYETEIQRLILALANLTDKLRESIPIELFWRQNDALNEKVTKYRKLVEDRFKNKNDSFDLLQRLQNDKLEIINNFQRNLNVKEKNGNSTTENLLSNIEESVLKKQVHELCIELNSKNEKIKYLEDRNVELQEKQSKIIDSTLASITKQDLDLMKSQLQTLAFDNKILKEKSQHVSSQLDIVLLQLQENQERQLSYDMEINILRHQILDLQSTSDNKAIVARLSGEVLVAHLQVTETNKKIERLNSALNKERELRVESEEMLKARQKIFDVYTFRYESKFRYIFEILQELRQQYQGSIPLISIENYLNKMEDVTRESQAVNEKLQEVEDLRSNLMTKHSVFDQILDVSRNKCIIEGDNCPHKLKTIMMKSTKTREIEHLHKKLQVLDQSRVEFVKRYSNLEKTLVLVNQGFGKSKIDNGVERHRSDGEISVSNLELEDVQSDDDSTSRKSKTITLPKPQILKPLKPNTANNAGKPVLEDTPTDGNVAYRPVEIDKGADRKTKLVNAQTQTVYEQHYYIHTAAQTMQDNTVDALKENILSLNSKLERQSRELAEAITIVHQRTKDNLVLSTEKVNLEASIQTLKSSYNYKESIMEKLQVDIVEMQNELGRFKSSQKAENVKKHDSVKNENMSLLLALKQLENDKDVIAAEYKALLGNEREEYAKTIKDLNVKNMELQSKLDRKGSDTNGINNEALKEVVGKYTIKIVELEDNCFKLQSELDECKAELKSYQTEVDRWKDLATERLAKMEQLNTQFGARHYQEVESYKAENQHWLSQLSDTQREHMELRSRLTEQKTLYVKQLADKDAQLEQMRSVINNLKTQVLNMQTLISVNDPSFDLSAIVEVEEPSDDAQSQRSDRLEIIKFDGCDVNESHDDFGRIGSSSTAIWQEPVVERLRREKQLAGKQNAILRRQIKALASRERRARLETQNLKNQVFRISTSGSKVTSAETAALHHKIASLTAQLTHARRDTNSSIALWDKWKRAQQAADRWQARFEDKCEEVKKLVHGLHLSKSAVARLDREKRVLLARLTEDKHESQQSIEKQEMEATEKEKHTVTECQTCQSSPPPVSYHALLERVAAQQRRIAALEMADKGNEILVSEYERALAEVTCLKGQLLKLESTVLEAQIRSPYSGHKDCQPDVDYWKK